MNTMRVIAPLIVASALLVACGKQLSSDDYLQRAEEQISRGKLDAAKVELKNAVAADVRNPEARLLLGKTYLETGDALGAAKEFRKALELGMPAEAVVSFLAQALLLTGEHAELAKLEVDTLSGPSQAIVFAAQALGKAADARMAEANDLVGKALGAHSDSTYALVAHARFLLAAQSVAPARAELEKAVRIDAGYAPAWSVLGDLELQERQLDEAERAFTKAIELRPHAFDDRLKRALVRLDRQDVEQAQEDVTVLKRMSPRHPGVAFAEGVLQMRNKQLDAARESLERAAEADRAYPLSLYLLAAIHLEQGNQAQADSYARRFVALAPDNPAGRKLAGALQLRAGDYARAEEYLRPVVGSGADDPDTLNLLANALIAQGKTDEGLELLKRVVELAPESPMAQARLGAGLVSTGDADLGMERLQEALRLDPSFQQADVLLVLSHARAKDFPAAIRAAEEYTQRHPGQATPINLLGQVYLSAGERAKAESAFGQVLALSPGEPQASHMLAAIALERKDLAAARGYYDGVLVHHAEHLPTLMKLAALAGAENDEAAMIQTLERAAKSHPEAADPRIALAAHHLGKADPDRALAALGDLDPDARKQPAVLQLLGAIQLNQRDYEAARASLFQLVDQQPGVAQFHYQLAMAHAGLGDSARMRTALEKAVELDSGLLPARVALARLMLAQGDIAGMESQVSALQRIQPGSSDVLQLESALAAAKGDRTAALAKSEEAFRAKPTTLTVVGYAQQLLRGGDGKRAVEVLEDWVLGHADDAPARMALADIYLAGGEKTKAAGLYEAVLSIDANHVAALNNLAWLKIDRDPLGAVTLAQRASELSPQSAAVLDTLALAQLRSGDLMGATRTVENARQIDPENPGLRFRAAQVKQAAGDVPGAVALLRPLIESNASFPEQSEAAELLRKLD